METFYILQGPVRLELLNEDVMCSVMMYDGESYTIMPNTPHRFSTPASGGAKILEVSSTHSDDDVVRLEESR